MKVLVCGSREYQDRAKMAQVLGCLPISSLCHGAARGADLLAGGWATANGVPVVSFPAAWDLHGKKAGPIRNRRMLKEFGPDLVIAFKDDFDRMLRRGGTEDMVKIALRANVKTWLVSNGVLDVLKPTLQGDLLCEQAAEAEEYLRSIPWTWLSPAGKILVDYNRYQAENAGLQTASDDFREVPSGA